MVRYDYFVILDYGSQYTQLIARRIRELGYYCEVHAPENPQLELNGREKTLKGIILSGGPSSVFATDAPTLSPVVLEINQKHQIPILGICYGMQLLCENFAGKVESAKHHEYGYAEVRAHGHSQLLKSVQDRENNQGFGLLDVWMSHGDQVIELPPTFKKIASTPNCPIAGFADENRKIYALQFHLEVTQTTQGKEILQRFVQQICQAKNQWKTENIIQQIIQEIRQTVGKDEVMLGLSGGVDSSVSAMLLHQAIGNQLSCVFIDNGLLRLDEAKTVEEIFVKHFAIKLTTINAQKTFMDSLKGENDPEKKRKIIGETFVRVFEKEAQKNKNIKWLAQGTIYSDMIESAGLGTTAKVIKSHHNVGGLPEKMGLKVIEPIKKLFKDEVRTVGQYMGLDKTFISRHPFPGTGLAVRIINEVCDEYAEILRKADYIYIEELVNNNYYHQLAQAFCVFLPLKSVGVVGDNRRYGWVIALRAVQTTDFMTAKWAELPYQLLGKISNRIVNEIPQVSRVVYDISGKPPATIEWE